MLAERFESIVHILEFAGNPLHKARLTEIAGTWRLGWRYDFVPQSTRCLALWFAPPAAARSLAEPMTHCLHGWIQLQTGTKGNEGNKREADFTEFILGTIRNGRVEMDALSDWPDGQRIAILPHLDDEPIGSVQWIELPSGRVVPFNGSPEHFKLLAEQIGRPNPVESTPEEESSMDEALRDMDRLYGDALRKFAE